jgi:hypothetical protein
MTIAERQPPHGSRNHTSELESGVVNLQPVEVLTEAQQFLQLLGDDDAVVTEQPLVSAREIQDKVHDILRRGQLGVVTFQDAMAYAGSLTPEQAHVRNYKGFKRCKPVGCCGGKCCNGCICAYFTYCGGNCLYFPMCVFGVPGACCSCMCQRRNNMWITQKKNRVRNVVVLLDHVNGIIGWYGSRHGIGISQTPLCYCV